MIKIEDLTVAFNKTEAVSHVSLDINDGEILGIVGESGSGKSVTALTLMGLVSEAATIKSGRIIFDGVTLLQSKSPRDKALYRKYQGDFMSMVFQEPMTSLNPTVRVGKQVLEMLKLHTRFGKDEMKKKVIEAFQSVGLSDPEKVYNSYPHELSGGMRQRVMISMAVILNPRLIVCDEPTTALDITVQNQIIELLRDINREHHNSMIFITHDLNLARRLCDRLAVMKDGKVCEIGNCEEVFSNPKEAYTKHLINSVPQRLKKRTTSDVITDKILLSVKDLNVYYKAGSNSLFGAKKRRLIVRNASFDIREGESLGLVGESGSGKTTLCKAILGLNPLVEGEIKCSVLRPQMIFQDPYSSLNPSKTIGWLMSEPLYAAGMKDRKERDKKVFEMLEMVGLPADYYTRKPDELSGGQRQRVSIGQALITRPGLVVCDEPVSALDVTIQAQIMELMRRLQRELKLSYLFISHDINVVYHMCDRIMVMHDGEIVEIGDTQEVFDNPRDEYTKILLKE